MNLSSPPKLQTVKTWVNENLRQLAPKLTTNLRPSTKALTYRKERGPCETFPKAMHQVTAKVLARKRRPWSLKVLSQLRQRNQSDSVSQAWRVHQRLRGAPQKPPQRIKRQPRQPQQPGLSERWHLKRRIGWHQSLRRLRKACSQTTNMHSWSRILGKTDFKDLLRQKRRWETQDTTLKVTSNSDISKREKNQGKNSNTINWDQKTMNVPQNSSTTGCKDIWKQDSDSTEFHWATIPLCWLLTGTRTKRNWQFWFTAPARLGQVFGHGKRLSITDWIKAPNCPTLRNWWKKTMVSSA